MSRHLVLIAGSSQTNSQSSRIARYLRQRWVNLGLGNSSDMIDLASAPLPLWPAPDTDKRWLAQQAILGQASALVVISPEWNGMACPALKNFFLYAGLAELGHKPALLVGVSAGLGGAYPIAELRGSSYKNCRILYLPEHLIIRNVEAMLHGDEPTDERDLRIRARADWALRMLCQYEVALREIRPAIEHPAPFATGM